MLRLKTSGEVRTTGARKTGRRAAIGILVAGLLMAGAAQELAQDTEMAPQAAQPRRQRHKQRQFEHHVEARAERLR